MKLRFYMDVLPGSVYAYGYWATTNPGAKAHGFRRIAFDVVVPDHMLETRPDFVLPEVGAPHVVSDDTDAP